jgi:sulfhydrogenase subunit delta
MECKRRGTPCVMVAQGITLPGAGHSRRMRRALPVLCPRLLRLLRADGDTQHRALSAWWRALDVSDQNIVRAFRGFNAYAEAFRKESEAHEHTDN